MPVAETLNVEIIHAFHVAQSLRLPMLKPHCFMDHFTPQSQTILVLTEATDNYNFSEDCL